MLRTQGRAHSMTFGLHGVREAARKDSQLRFTALLHHVNEDCLRNAFFNLKKTASVGVDGVTWQDYEQDLEVNIADLHERIHRGAFPCRRESQCFSQACQVCGAEAPDRPLSAASNSFAPGTPCSLLTGAQA